jgi:hypothetical protein
MPELMLQEIAEWPYRMTFAEMSLPNGIAE